MIKYYIYIHREAISGKVFYIGRGYGDRAYRAGNKRSKEWNRVALNGYSVEFLHQDLTKQESVILENKYLNEPDQDWILCNKKKAEQVKDLNLILDQFNEWFEYDETVPSCLKWKKNTIGKKRAGCSAGSKNKLGYFELKFRGISYYVHRVIYAIKHGGLDTNKVIDHIDGNSSNNKISNLRQISQRQNTQNRKLNKRESSTGYIGVYLQINKSGNMYYKSTYYNLSGKLKSKYFSVKKLGQEEALKQAVEFRNSSIDNLNKVGMSYTLNHTGAIYE